MTLPNFKSIDSTNWIKWFDQLITLQGFSLSEDQLKQMVLYGKELLEWNRIINLTTIVDPCEIAIKHFLDSMFVTTILCNSVMHVLDIGTGAGFPGIPIKIIRPDLSMDLVDSSQKRVHFLKHITHMLKLKNCHVHHCRIEKYHSPLLYDYIVSRAYSSIMTIVNQSHHLLKKNGTLILMKGKNYMDEVNALNETCFSLTIHSYQLPVIRHDRKLVCLTCKSNHE